MSTPEQDLLSIAEKIARRAPVRQGQYVSFAKIPWYLITDLRDTLDRLGIDWQAKP